MVWVLIMFWSIGGVLVGLGEVLVALLLLLQITLVHLFGERIGGAVALLAMCALFGLGVYYMECSDSTDEEPAPFESAKDTAVRTSEPRTRERASPVVKTRCGRGEPHGDLEAEAWSGYRCQERRDDACLGWREYTDSRRHGCPGAALCCPAE
jgi:hypothetical protein